MSPDIEKPQTALKKTTPHVSVIALECIDNECSTNHRMSKKIQIIQMEICLHHRHVHSAASLV